MLLTVLRSIFREEEASKRRKERKPFPFVVGVIYLHDCGGEIEQPETQLSLIGPLLGKKYKSCIPVLNKLEQASEPKGSLIKKEWAKFLSKMCLMTNRSPSNHNDIESITVHALKTGITNKEGVQLMKELGEGKALKKTAVGKEYERQVKAKIETPSLQPLQKRALKEELDRWNKCAYPACPPACKCVFWRQCTYKTNCPCGYHV